MVDHTLSKAVFSTDVGRRLEALEIRTLEYENFIRANIGKIVSVNSVEACIDAVKLDVADIVLQSQVEVSKLEDKINDLYEMFGLSEIQYIKLKGRVEYLEKANDENMYKIGCLYERLDNAYLAAKELKADTVRVTDRLENLIVEDREKFNSHQKLMAEFVLKMTHAVTLLTEANLDKKK